MNAQNIAAISALTPTQEGILFHVIKAPERRAYHSQFSALMHGPLDEPKWLAAWTAVIARHAILRTLFTWQGRDKPLQLVRHHVETPWQTLDWRDASMPEQDAQLTALLQRDRDLGFDLTSAPLLRCLSIRLGETSWRFVLSFHHLILDGWSMRLIIDDARRFYRQRMAGDTIDTTPAPSFTRFVEWHEQRDGADDERFWQHRLGTFASPVFPDVSDGQPPQSNSHVLVESTLDGAVRAALTQMCREQRVTQSSLVSAAWALTLAAYTQQEDLVFGITMAGRPSPLDDVEKMAGLFINTLPLRVGWQRQDTVDAFVQHVHARQIELRGVESSPLSVAQRSSAVPAGVPLFESIVVYENFPAANEVAQNEPVTFDLDRFVEYSHFPLALLAVPDDDFRLILISDPRRINSDAAREMLDRVVSILTALASRAPGNLANFLSLPAAQTKRVVREFNDTDAPTEPFTAPWSHIVRAAERTPNHTALIDEQHRLSYRELVTVASKVAARLGSLGVTSGEPVAIVADRSTQSVATILGVMACGATYVPISPDAPLARVEQILDQLGSDARQAILIVSAASVANVPATARTLLRDTLFEGKVPEDTPTPDIGKDDTAYIIYTSGSTGTPKGVCVSQSNLFHSVDARDRYYGDAPNNFLLLSALTTDSSVAGLYWTLCRGGTLTLARERAEQDLNALIETIATGQVSHLLCVPALWNLILENGSRAALANLRVVIVAGEACPDALVLQHATSLPTTELHNEYGPTEATVWCTATRLQPDTPVTIGKPIANTRVYVLDTALQPLPIGVAGELCVGGAQVTPGYLNDPLRTAERFVANPFIAGDRLYRTGDRVRWHRDGNLAFVGRVDLQMKIRGFRVEPGDIEACLKAHDAVTDAVVMVRDSSEPSGRSRLVAFVAVTASIEHERLRAHVAAQLPSHMVPQHCEQLDRLPRTPSGKIDRAALAERDLNAAARPSAQQQRGARQQR